MKDKRLIGMGIVLASLFVLFKTNGTIQVIEEYKSIDGIVTVLTTGICLVLPSIVGYLSSR